MPPRTPPSPPIDLGPGRPEPLIGAHRGGARDAPENTLAAFAEGIERGADLIELDVHLSRDGELVVIHDHTVDRTTDGSGAVHDLTLAELQRLDAGGWFAPRFAGERIPSLAEVVAAVDRRAGLAIELKGWPAAATDLADAVVALLEQTRTVETTLVIAFDHWAAQRVKERNPAIKTAINYHARLVDPLHAGRAAGADVLNQAWLFCDRAFCQQAHAAGFAVQCLAPTPALAWALARNGVDIIDSDEPDLAKAASRAGAPRPEGATTPFA